MFLFSCCQSVESKYGYEVRRGNKVNFYHSLKDIDERDKTSGGV